MAVRRASFSTMLSSGESLPSTPSKDSPSSPISAWSDATGAVAKSTSAISSGVRPVAWDSSDRTGSRPISADSDARAFWMR